MGNLCPLVISGLQRRSGSRAKVPHETFGLHVGWNVSEQAAAKHPDANAAADETCSACPLWPNTWGPSWYDRSREHPKHHWQYTSFAPIHRYYSTMVSKCIRWRLHKPASGTSNDESRLSVTALQPITPMRQRPLTESDHLTPLHTLDNHADDSEWSCWN